MRTSTTSQNVEAPLLSHCTLTEWEMVQLIRQGLPAKQLKVAADQLKIPLSQLIEWMGLRPRSVSKLIKNQGKLSHSSSELCLGLFQLIRKVEVMITEIGVPDDYSIPEYLGLWMSEPAFALGGVAPGTLLDTMKGQDLLYASFSRMVYGIYQ